MINKILCSVALIITGANMIYPSALIDALTQPSSITITQDGVDYECNDAEQQLIIDSIKEIFNSHREMPAFGVSLDKETRDAKTSGLWIELVYNTPVKYIGMCFDKLLIEVDRNYTGFNIIRHYKGKYDGRCYYVDLSTSMEPLYNTLIDITKKD